MNNEYIPIHNFIKLYDSYNFIILHFILISLIKNKNIFPMLLFDFFLLLIERNIKS